MKQTPASSARSRHSPKDACISPSDIDAHHGEAEVRVGGRVRETNGLDLVLADAFATIDVELVEASAIEAGELAVVAGVPAEGRLLQARLVERYGVKAPPLPQDGDEGRPGETGRLQDQAVGQSLVARSFAFGAIRAFFGRERFLEVDTPLLVPSPGMDLHLDAFEVTGTDRFRYLITSPEYQMKRLLVGGIPRCFQLAHCFRRGEVGANHNPEFMMLEWYRAFASMADVMDDTERLVRFVAEELTGGATLSVGGSSIDLTGDFARISVADAFAEHAGIAPNDALDLAERDEEAFFRLLVDRVEPALARLGRPVFLVDYPAVFASLARRKPDNPRLAERFELYAGGIELCNGFGELTDPIEQRARFEKDQEQRRRTGKPVYPIDEAFVKALEEGLPPSAGNALGVDRLVALCIGAPEIASVQAFPATCL